MLRFTTRRTNAPTTRGLRYDPWAHAAYLGIDVQATHLETAHGLWVPDERTILVHSEIQPRYQRTVLAHEIGHAIHGHRDDRPKHEKQADKFAAYHLIDPGELVGLYGVANDEQSLVDELRVTTRLFRAYVLHHHQPALGRARA